MRVDCTCTCTCVRLLEGGSLNIEASSACKDTLSDFLPSELVHDDDLTLGFVRLNNLPAMHVVQINNGQEYILCFNGKHVHFKATQPWNMNCFDSLSKE